MSFNAATLKLMLEKGLTLGDVVEIAFANQEKTDTAAERRRAWDRDRKRQKREEEREMSGGMSGGNPPDPAPNDIDNLTPTQVTPIEPIGSKPRGRFPAPDGVSAEQWTDFLAVRRSKRAGRMTETGYSRLCAKLSKLAEDGWPPGEMVGLAVERGWTSVFAPKDFGNERTDHNPTRSAVERIIASHG